MHSGSHCCAGSHVMLELYLFAPIGYGVEQCVLWLHRVWGEGGKAIPLRGAAGGDGEFLCCAFPRVCKLFRQDSNCCFVFNAKPIIYKVSWVGRECRPSWCFFCIKQSIPDGTPLKAICTAFL